jgi:pSer/pThr/pTyr-binding forkhead associated (FHA) protein
MSELSALTLTIIRLGFLAILWLFILTAVSVMRSDLFGTRVTPRGPIAPRAAKQAKPAKARKGTPRNLVVTEGALAGTSVGLGEAPVTLGRAQDCTIVLDDDYASSRHARIFPRDGQWWVEDLGSTNGTYLDRIRLTSPTTVPPGVPVRVGKTVLELRT